MTNSDAKKACIGIESHAKKSAVEERSVKETLTYSRVCARIRFWSSGKARCRFGSRRYRAGGATPPGAETGRARRVGPHFSRLLRSAPCLGKNADSNAGVRINQCFLKEPLAGIR